MMRVLAAPPSPYVRFEEIQYFAFSSRYVFQEKKKNKKTLTKNARKKPQSSWIPLLELGVCVLSGLAPLSSVFSQTYAGSLDTL